MVPPAAAAPTDIGAQLTAAAATAGPLMAEPIVNAASLFQSAFGTGAASLQAAGASIITAGSSAASTITAAMPGAGAALGAAAAAAIRSAVSGITVNVNANVVGGGSKGGDPGHSKAD